MKIEQLKKIAVIGAGDMGHGIAQVGLMAGYQVNLCDIKQEFVDRGISRIYASLDKLASKGKVDPALVEQIKGGRLNGYISIAEAVKDADVLYTDVWASMGQEGEAEERKKIFKSYQINDEAMALAADGAMVLHCLPAHREEEITAKVFEEHADEIFDEAENRLHAQKAVMVKCMGDGTH